MIEKISNRTLLLAGVRKCGTTTLFNMLANHSKICPASIKESQFFACDEETIIKNLSWYKQLFNTSNNAVLLDGSTWYFGASDAPKLINQHLPKSQIILSLRDPATRVFSAYQHMKKQTPSKEMRTFDQIITSMEDRVKVGDNLYDAEDTLLDLAVKHDLLDADYIKANFHKNLLVAPFNTQLSDKRIEFRYFGESCYSRWLTPWKQTFGDRLHIIYFEDLMTQPESVIRGILQFAELDLEDAAASLLKKNETQLPKGKLSSKILSYRRNSRIGRLSASVLKSVGLKSLGAKYKKKFLYKNKENATAEQIQRVRVLLADEYDYWEKQDQRTARLWSIPKTR